MELHAYANHYLGKGMFVVWSIPAPNMNSFEVLRDGKRIAYSANRKETHDLFEHPEMFDNDHHTWLFKKDSPYKFIYQDEEPQIYQRYTYEVIARYIVEDGTVMAIATTGKVVAY